MRIAIDIRDLQVARTGAHTVLKELTQVFESVAPEYEFIYLKPKWDILPKKSILSKVAGHFAFLLWKEVELPWQAWRKNCDIIFCTDYVVPLYSRCPTVPVFYDASFWSRPQDYNKFWRWVLDHFALPAALKSPAVITISEAARRNIAQHTKIPYEKLIPVHLAPKSALRNKVSPSDQERVLARYGVSGCKYVLHVGVMEKRKNLPRLIQAFGLVVPEIAKDVKLVIIGQPGPKIDLDDSRNIETVIQELHLQDRVVLTGYMPDEDLAAFYRGAHLYAFPSLQEGFGIPMLEAYINDLPVIASTASSIPEVAGDAAIYFNPEDVNEIARALISGIKDLELRERLVVLGRKRVEEFSWEITALKMLAVFDNIVNQKALLSNYV